MIRKTANRSRPRWIDRSSATAVIPSKSGSQARPRRTHGLGANLRCGHRTLRREDETARSAGALQTTRAAGRVSERLDQAEAEAQTLRHARSIEGPLRSPVGRHDLQLATHVPAGPGVAKTANRQPLASASERNHDSLPPRSYPDLPNPGRHRFLTPQYTPKPIDSRLPGPGRPS